MSHTLIDTVQALLAQHNPKLAKQFRRQFNDTQALHVFSLGELGSLNRFWRLELGNLGIDTIDERECLIDGIDVTVWLNNFQVSVIPTIVQNWLPRGR